MSNLADQKAPQGAGALGRRFLRAVGDLLWPPVCAVCPRLLPLVDDENSPEGEFCPFCLESVEWLPQNICSLCGRPFYQAAEPRRVKTPPQINGDSTIAAGKRLNSALTDHVCGDCLADPPPYRQARSAVVYSGAAARSISLLKYYGDLCQAASLATLAARLTEAPWFPLPDFSSGPRRGNAPPQFSGGLDVSAGNGLDSPVTAYDYILPMPISPGRLRRRGFNQAAELAFKIYAPWRHLINENILRRSKDGHARQAGLSAARRRRAIKGCFEVPEPAMIRNAGLLLFDDVYTTGATVYEAVGTLMKAGAAFVDVATLARTVRNDWR